MWWSDTGDFSIAYIMRVAVTSAVSVIGALLMFRRQKVCRDQRACFDRLYEAGFQRYGTYAQERGICLEVRVGGRVCTYGISAYRRKVVGSLQLSRSCVLCASHASVA